MAMLGLAVFLVVAFFAAAAPMFADYEADAVKQNVYTKFFSPGQEGHPITFSFSDPTNLAGRRPLCSTKKKKKR